MTGNLVRVPLARPDTVRAHMFARAAARAALRRRGQGPMRAITLHVIMDLVRGEDAIASPGARAAPRLFDPRAADCQVFRFSPGRATAIVRR